MDDWTHWLIVGYLFALVLALLLMAAFGTWATEKRDADTCEREYQREYVKFVETPYNWAEDDD